MAPSSELEDAPKSKKKRFFFRKSSKKQKEGGKKDTKSVVSTELEQRVQLDSEDYATSRKESRQNLIALAYKNKEENSSFIRQSSRRQTKPTPIVKTSTKTTKGSSMFSFTGSSFFRKLCDDVFDTIDVDKSGKINESELYQGLLLIHLKLGMYFGPAACKPIALDRTKYIFQNLDTNRDGFLDKEEFQKVLAVLMGNVVFRIAFQFVCTLLIVPFLANTIWDNIVDGYGIFTQSWLPVFREKYQPLIEVALGVDLVKGFASTAFAATNDAVHKTGIPNVVSNITQVPAQFVAEKYDAFVVQPIGEIPQETWDSLPLTVLSTILALIIVPYSIVKTDDFFRYLATRSGRKGPKS